jgi:nucleoside-diphosphate-sugar epimerase
VRILVTGSAGFINGYLIEELLQAGHTVVGIDNFSKYGRVQRRYADDPHYEFVEGDASDVDLLTRLIHGCDQLVASAARIGGISYFHEYAYDLLAENERITAAHFDAALAGFKAGTLKKINVISSSMVYEHATVFPTPEDHLDECPPPSSTYGFQKLACEYFARGACQQYGLPYTVIRPFNCVGIGEQRALGGREVPSGNVHLAMSHVVPDLVQKVVKGQDPLHILGDGRQVRHYTYGGDLARGIRLCIEDPAAINQAFNLSTAEQTTVVELAKAIWRRLRPEIPFRYVSDAPYPHDVCYRSPDVSKARRLLGFEATTRLEQMLDEVVPWVQQSVAAGVI